MEAFDISFHGASANAVDNRQWQREREGGVFLTDAEWRDGAWRNRGREWSRTGRGYPSEYECMVS